MKTFASILLTTVLSAALPAASPDAGVRHTIAMLDRDWNAHDMHAFAARFTPDADLVNTAGMHWKGRPTIEKALTRLHHAMFRHVGIGTSEVEVRSLSPNVALAVCRGHQDAFTSGGGHQYPASDLRSTYVLIEKNGEWRIASAQITPIDAMAAPHDPAKA